MPYRYWFLAVTLAFTAVAATAQTGNERRASDPVPWIDQDGCLRLLDRPGGTTMLERRVGPAGNAVCPEDWGEVRRTEDESSRLREAYFSGEIEPVILEHPTTPAPQSEDVGIRGLPQQSTEIDVLPDALQPLRPRQNTSTPATGAPSSAGQAQPRAVQQQLLPVPRPSQSNFEIETPTPDDGTPLSAVPDFKPESFAIAQANSGRFMIQVAAFGVQENLDRTRARFEATGFPVTTSASQFRGQQVTLLRLGPFLSEASAETALMIARAAGFGDAYVVRVNGG
ncbi:MAG: SPOR domain-containing protein [Pseudomonadota bacterium]